MTLEAFYIILPAFVVGLLVFATHVPLGIEVLKRGIIFIDLAIAQIAALGVIVSGALLHDVPFYVEQIFALGFALAGAFLFRKIESILPNEQEAIIGASFIFASSLALLLVSHNPHGGEELQAMLAGQILWVGWKEIAITALLYSVILVVWFTGRAAGRFYFLFAIVVTTSVQLVGVYMVFASLILPALATVCSVKNRLLKCYVLSFCSLVVGLILSVVTDYPTGPVIVCTLAVGSLLVMFLMRKMGGSRLS